jgi:hypothetical protein
MLRMAITAKIIIKKYLIILYKENAKLFSRSYKSNIR